MVFMFNFFLSEKKTCRHSCLISLWYSKLVLFAGRSLSLLWMIPRPPSRMASTSDMLLSSSLSLWSPSSSTIAANPTLTRLVLMVLNLPLWSSSAVLVIGVASTCILPTCSNLSSDGRWDMLRCARCAAAQRLNQKHTVIREYPASRRGVVSFPRLLMFACFAVGRRLGSVRCCSNMSTQCALSLYCFLHKYKYIEMRRIVWILSPL